MRLIDTLRRLPTRLWLACKYWLRLNYGWHLAWAKAERGAW